MAGIKQALLFASGGRYLTMFGGIASAAVVGRYLTPSDFGVAVLGTAVFSVAEAFRELASPSYLIQHHKLSDDNVTTLFTVNVITTAAVVCLLLSASVPLTWVYDMSGLAAYIQIMCLAYVTGPFVYPIFGLFSRTMAFHKLAMLDSLSALVGIAVTIGLLVGGFGYMSLAWAAVASSTTALLVGLLLWRDLGIFRLSLKDWRGVLSFGVFGSAAALLTSTADAIFYLIAGRIMSPGAIGLLQRSQMLANFPERVISAGIGAIALPSFSLRAREGKDLKAGYLSAIANITAVEWPALLCLGILAAPITSTLLGPKWSDVVPIMTIITVGLMFNFPSLLNSPLQVASGGIRHATIVTAMQVAASFLAKMLAAPHGAAAVACAIALVVPVNVTLALFVLKLRMSFQWREIGAAIWKSGVAAGAFAVATIAVVGLNPWDGSVGLRQAIVAALFGTAAWFIVLWLTGHPILKEFPTAKAFRAAVDRARWKIPAVVRALR